MEFYKQEMLKLRTDVDDEIVVNNDNKKFSTNDIIIKKQTPNNLTPITSTTQTTQNTPKRRKKMNDKTENLATDIILNHFDSNCNIKREIAIIREIESKTSEYNDKICKVKDEEKKINDIEEFIDLVKELNTRKVVEKYKNKKL